MVSLGSISIRSSLTRPTYLFAAGRVSRLVWVLPLQVANRSGWEGVYRLSQQPVSTHWLGSLNSTLLPSEPDRHPTHVICRSGSQDGSGFDVFLLQRRTIILNDENFEMILPWTMKEQWHAHCTLDSRKRECQHALQFACGFGLWNFVWYKQCPFAFQSWKVIEVIHLCTSLARCFYSDL